MLVHRQVDTVLHAIQRLLPAIQSLFSWICEFDDAVEEKVIALFEIQRVFYSKWEIKLERREKI